MLDLLHSQGFESRNEPFSWSSRVLTREPFPLGHSLAARFGRIYVQDRSSMLPPLMLAPPRGAAVLDMCSAPGSKTGLLSGLVGKNGFVLACEASPDRTGTLRANLKRTCAVNTATLCMQAQKLTFADETWDHILLDPPCSGWGTAERNPEVLELWVDEKTVPLVRLQRKLLTRAASMLRPGGRLLYSTCTTNVEEDEEQTLWAIDELGLKLCPLEAPPGFDFDPPELPGIQGVLRVSPQGHGQGFYMACLTKPGSTQTLAQANHEHGLPGKELSPPLPGPDNAHWPGLPPGKLYDFSDRVFFLHEKALEIMPKGLKWQGHPLGKISKNGFRPDAAARIILPQKPRQGCLDLDDAQALEGLISGQSLDAAATGLKKGRAGLYYKGLPLGWATVKGNRLLWAER